ncbi:DUF4234 domain-containing protein [Bacteriovoracaceae bacterium]|nr:DUF4234 domain-containing protein [Bacteriovoracaceae bacterium]
MVNRKNVLIDIILTLITGGLWNFWVQYRQIRDTNNLLGGNEVRSFWMVMLFSFLTFGLYFAYHEFTLCKRLHFLVYGDEKFEVSLLISLLTFFALWFVVDSYQQTLINLYLEGKSSI